MQFLEKINDNNFTYQATNFMEALSYYFPNEYIDSFIKVLRHYVPYYRMNQENIWFYMFLISAAKRYAKKQRPRFYTN